MLGNKILHWGCLNENSNYRKGNLIIHGHIVLHGGDLNGNGHFKTTYFSFDLWDRRINVIWAPPHPQSVELFD